MATLSPHSIHGYLLLNKPTGPSTYDLIRWTKRSLKKIKIGHSGTLDPLARGLVILLIGRITKKQSEFMGHNKVYRCRMALGNQTDSGDITGAVVESKPLVPLSQKSIEKVFHRFIGEQTQIPPMFSALKKNGVPLYKLARKGKIIEREPRRIVIHQLNYLSHTPLDIEFRAEVSAGTYLRVLVEDIAKQLGTCAAMAELEREAVGPYHLKDALDGEKLKNFSSQEIIENLH